MTDGSHIGKLETEMKQLATLKRKSSPLLHTQEKSKEYKEERNFKRPNNHEQCITSLCVHFLFLSDLKRLMDDGTFNVTWQPIIRNGSYTFCFTRELKTEGRAISPKSRKELHTLQADLGHNLLGLVSRHERRRNAP